MQQSVHSFDSVSILEVAPDEAGQRLDNYLISRLKGAPKSLIYRIIRKGEVRVNKGRVKPDRKLAAGDLVRVPPVRVATAVPPPKPSDNLAEVLRRGILFEDEALMVINKPSGLAVHGGSGVSLGLIEALRQIRPECRFLELVHRLDRDTSGCVMVAKKRSMLRFLQDALRRAGGIDKQYLALVEGRWPNRRHVVEAPLRKNELQGGERVVRVDISGKACRTEFSIEQRFGEATLVRAKPITGRTHQIRVHALHAGHPIVGDEKYGRDEFNRAMKQFGFKRLFLHALALVVPLPDGGSLQVEAPLPEDLVAGLARLSPAESVSE
jgi:23S rRNA pseudouridine955/2504/2580 synthase